MRKDLKEEPDRRRKAWAAFEPHKEAADQMTDLELRARLFDSTVLPAFYYAAEKWTDTAATLTTLHTIHRAFESCLLNYNELNIRRTSDLWRMLLLRDPAKYESEGKHLVGPSYNEKGI